MSRCILCNISKSQKHLFTKEGNRIIKCKKCGLMYIHPIPPVNPNVYDGSYISYWDKSIHVEKEANMRLELISRYKSSGKLLDIGCGTGIFLQQAKKAGWEVYGTEISKWAAAYVRKKYRFEIFEGVLKEAHFPDNFFDVVTLWHVLEHIPEPIEELKEIHRILKHNGILCVEVPNASSIDCLVKGRNWKCFGAEHIYYFSNSTLLLAGKIAGFKPIFVKRISGSEKREHRYNILKKMLHKILTSLNMGNRLLCIFEKEV